MAKQGTEIPDTKKPEWILGYMMLSNWTLAEPEHWHSYQDIDIDAYAKLVVVLYL